MSDLQTFVSALCEGLTGDERLTANGFFGDPKSIDMRKWRVIPVNSCEGRWIVPGNTDANRYISVGAFQPDPKSGRYYRQDAFWTGAVGLMIDDLGAEIGGAIKVPFAALNGVPPTFIIETSPCNHQAWYLFKEVLRDKRKFEQLVRQFIAVKCNGADPGMSGTTRVGRTPESVNGKPVNHNWRVRIVHQRIDLRYAPEQLAVLWGLDLDHRAWEKQRPPPPKDTSGLVANFELVLEMLHIWGHSHNGRTGLHKGKLDPGDFNGKGWMQIRCPWIDDHGGGTDDGAAVAMPMESNRFIGGFKCHHGLCGDRTYSDLLRYVKETLNDEFVEEMAARLEKINRKESQK